MKQEGLQNDVFLKKGGMNLVRKREMMPVNEQEMEWFYTVNNITKTGKLIVKKRPNMAKLPDSWDRA